MPHTLKTSIQNLYHFVVMLLSSIFQPLRKFSILQEEIPALIETLDDKVKNFIGSLEDRKELLKEVADGTSSVLQTLSNSRETVAMETAFDLSIGVTGEVKDLIDVDSPDMSPIEQLEQKKKEQERLKSRVCFSFSLNQKHEVLSFLKSFRL